jgi:hypothetical protein
MMKGVQNFPIKSCPTMKGSEDFFFQNSIKNPKRWSNLREKAHNRHLSTI